MVIYMGADHAGYELKNDLIKYLQDEGHKVEDLGAKSLDKLDNYPDYAYSVAAKILGGNDNDRGILICGSGHGMNMAANRVNGIRAALCWDEATAEASRREDNANVLVLASRHITTAAAKDIVDKWLGTGFSDNPKYARRLGELEQLYG